MNEDEIQSANRSLPVRSEDFDLLEPFYSSPTTELYGIRVGTNHDIAVAKRLPIAYRDDPAQRDQFRTECEFLRTLDHPGVSKAGYHFDLERETVQILFPGRYLTIGQLTETCRRTERRLPPEIGLCIVEQILHAMNYVHEQATKDARIGIDTVLHPDSLLVDSAGRVLVTTIGLNGPPHIASSILRVGNTSYFIYAAPEQCVAGRVPDDRACFYTLGMICYELLTGRALFSQEVVHDPDCVIRRKLRLLHPLVSDVAPDLAIIDDLMVGLLDPVPESRETDGGVVLETITRLRPEIPRRAPEDVALCCAELETALRDRLNQEDEAGIAGDLSAVSDIAQYNAS